MKQWQGAAVIFVVVVVVTIQQTHLLNSQHAQPRLETHHSLGQLDAASRAEVAAVLEELDAARAQLEGATRALRAEQELASAARATSAAGEAADVRRARDRLEADVAAFERERRAAAANAAANATAAAAAAHLRCDEAAARAAAAAAAAERRRQQRPVAAAAGAPLFLGILMHVDRGAQNYLRRALKSLDRELGAPGAAVGAAARILVADATAGAEGRAFAEARSAHGGALFDFYRLAAGRRRLLAGGPKVAKQSRDVVAAASHALRTYDFRYAVLLEDDWVACHGLLAALVAAVARADAVHGAFAALRVSYGLNGIVVPKSELAALAAHVGARAGAKPPDLAFTEWALAAPKPLVAYRHNLFVHVGAASSIGNAGSRWNTACFELLFDWLQVDGEVFDVHKCAHDVVSPCGPPPRRLPHPKRQDKKFGCDVALMDLPVNLISDRVLQCVRPAVKGKALALLPASADSKD